MIFFWKVFAWIAFGWAVATGRKKGVLILKKPSQDDYEKPLSGPGWRRVSSSRGYPGRKKTPDPPSEPVAEADDLEEDTER